MSEARQAYLPFGKRVVQLGALSLADLYSIFEELRVVHEKVEKSLKYTLNNIYEKRYGESLVIDDKAIVTDKPERVVEALAARVAEIVKKEYLNQGVVVTEASVRSEATKRAMDLLTEALKAIILKYGAW
ncbi:MAG: hypothetical protein QXZ31_03695 [Thermofilaceae archaeon]